MAYLFVHYPRCSTCRKARKWLDENGVDYTERDIVKQNPQADELREWVKQSGFKTRRFFNTSGIKYRELHLKDKLGDMSDDEMLALLATDGMLVKRPILVGNGQVQVGFIQKEWEKLL